MVDIDLSRDSLLTEVGILTLKDRYLLPGETSPQEAFARAALAFSDSQEMAQRIYDYASKQWFMFSTPALSNAPVRKSFVDSTVHWSWNFHPHYFKKSRGLPVSCFLNYVDDSLAGIGAHWVENMYLASRGGGIGGHYSSLRSDGTATSKGSSSNGIIPFIKVVDSEMSAVSQGKTRRGSYASWLDISHPEIEEFLVMRKATGGDINRKALNTHHGVNITDEFMQIIEARMVDPLASDDWPLVDPHSGSVTKIISATGLWSRILETRMETGEPYIAFIDEINRKLPETQRALGLKSHGSNLCAEITEATNAERTAVCTLSSVNAARYDEWKDSKQFIPDLIRFLDNMTEYFIHNAPDEMWRAKASAKAERSLGLGLMGFHTYLQSKDIPWGTAIAKGVNNAIFKSIKDKAVRASEELAELRGEASDMLGTGRRNAHLMAIAPNATSSLVCGGVSPSIEPFRANAFIQKTLGGTFMIKNPEFAKVLLKYAEEFHYSDLKARAEWMDKQWRSITTNKGSVQHLGYLSKWEKEVFQTAPEIDQRWIIDLASDRQQYVCQSQSVNLFLPPDVHVTLLHDLHFTAWKRKMKTLYYVRSEAIKRAEVVSAKVERKNLYRFDEETCLACEG